MTEATSNVGAVNPIEVLETGFEHSRIEHGGLEADQTERLVALGNITARPRGALPMWRSRNQPLRRRQKEIPETDLQRTGERRVRIRSHRPPTPLRGLIGEQKACRADPMARG